MRRLPSVSLLIIVCGAACSAPRPLPQVSLEGTYNSTGPVTRDGIVYQRARFDFTPDGFWTEADVLPISAEFYSNGTYEFDGITLRLKSTLSWQGIRTGTVHNDTITLGDVSNLTLVR